MDQVISIMKMLIKSVICNEPVDKNLIATISPDVLRQLYLLSNKHDLAHMVAYALKQENALGHDEVSELFYKSIYVAVARHTRIVTEQKKICDVLEKNRIVHVPLKGAEIRDYYPEAWLRTSCDIDILIRREEVKGAEECLIRELNYRRGHNNYHDISFYSESGVHLELHFSILENDRRIDGMLQTVWEHLESIEGYKYRRCMEPAYFVFYQMAHAMHHFIYGGCGVRFLIDLWVINNKKFYNKEVSLSYYEQCGISIFCEELNHLVGVWFQGMQHSKTSEVMEKYILDGGVYGTKSNFIAATRSRTENSGRWNYWWRRVFVPYSTLASEKEKLRKQPILYPYYLVKRWFKIFKLDMRKSLEREIKADYSLHPKKMSEVKELFDELNLRKF